MGFRGIFTFKTGGKTELDGLYLKGRDKSRELVGHHLSRDGRLYQKPTFESTFGTTKAK